MQRKKTVGKCIKQIVVYSYNLVLLTNVDAYNMGESQKHAAWRNTDTEEYRLSDSFYMKF